MQINAVRGFPIHINTAVVVVNHGDGLLLIVPHGFLSANAGGSIFRARLQRFAGFDGHRAAGASRAVLFHNCACPLDPYYSFDGGKTFEPMTDAEFEARFPTPDVEWWTYDEYKAWLDNEKVQLQSLLGEEAWTSSDGSFIWTQEKIDETIALYEGILEDMKNGVMYSKNVDGQDDVLLSYNPADISTSAD